LRKQLLATPIRQRAARTHFLENHDERRIAGVLSPAEHRAAALLVLGLPGMRLLYEGQIHGWRQYVPVQLGCWPDESTEPEILSMYEQLLTALKASTVGRGECRLLDHRAELGNESAGNFVIIQWRTSPREVDLVVVNLTPHSSRCRVLPAIDTPAANGWALRDLLGTGSSRKAGTCLPSGEFSFEAAAHAAHLFRLMPRAGRLK